MVNKHIIAALTATLTFMLPYAATASETPTPIVGAQGGTTGAGFSVGVDLPHDSKLRFTEGSLGYNFKGNTSGVNYTGDFHPETVSLLIDNRPFTNSPFKVTAGAYLTNTSVSFTGRDVNTVTINGTTYSENEVGSVTGEAYWHRLSPYLGTGIDTTPRSGSGVGFVVDAGAFYQGAPTTTLRTQYTPNDPSFGPNLEQARQTLATEVGHYHIYPVFTVGLTARI